MKLRPREKVVPRARHQPSPPPASWRVRRKAEAGLARPSGGCYAFQLRRPCPEHLARDAARWHRLVCCHPTVPSNAPAAAGVTARCPHVTSLCDKKPIAAATPPQPILLAVLGLRKARTHFCIEKQKTAAWPSWPPRARRLLRQTVRRDNERPAGLRTLTPCNEDTCRHALCQSFSGHEGRGVRWSGAFPAWEMASARVRTMELELVRLTGQSQ